MLRRRTGFPEEGDLILCKVTSVQHHSVFVHIDDYNTSGMIHISEVSPGRIRNIRDFVKEGKVVVCKVLRVNKERGHIDLSLRRVSDNQRRIKVTEIKQEQKAEKIIEYLAKQMKLPLNDVYGEISSKINESYDNIFSSFMDVVNDETTFEKLGVKKEIADPLEELVKQRIKPVEVNIKGSLSLSTYAPDGVEIVKKALTASKKAGGDIAYVGAGKYLVRVKAPDYKSAEKILAASAKAASDIVEKSGGAASFDRENA